MELRMSNCDRIRSRVAIIGWDFQTKTETPLNKKIFSLKARAADAGREKRRLEASAKNAYCSRDASTMAL
ncbi:MAG TPA: hypothetical protein VKL99_08460, partial [Candidatus Angelobacter sp.]|nr:hypothetical protein [Candidatus Angelobacter sp.]